jgi:hypothetical protein
MNFLLTLSAMAILIGALCKLQHWPFGDHILWGGFLTQFIFGSIEISRLKKIIKNLNDRKFAE